MLSPTENSIIQGLLKAFVQFSRTFQGLFIFKDFSRKLSKIKYFSSLCEPCFKGFLILKILIKSEPILRIFKIKTLKMGTDLFVNQGSIFKIFKIRPVEKIVYVILLHGADHPANLCTLIMAFVILALEKACTYQFQYSSYSLLLSKLFDSYLVANAEDRLSHLTAH